MISLSLVSTFSPERKQSHSLLLFITNDIYTLTQIWQNQYEQTIHYDEHWKGWKWQMRCDERRKRTTTRCLCAKLLYSSSHYVIINSYFFHETDFLSFFLCVSETMFPVQLLTTTTITTAMLSLSSAQVQTRAPEEEDVVCWDLVCSLVISPLSWKSYCKNIPLSSQLRK